MSLAAISSRPWKVQEEGADRQRSRTASPHTELRHEDLGMYSQVKTYSTSQGPAHHVSNNTTTVGTARAQPHPGTGRLDLVAPSEPSTSHST